MSGCQSWNHRTPCKPIESPALSALPSRIAAAEWLAAGFLLTFSSVFGQTFFIAMFSDEIRREVGIGNGAFGTSYMVATLISSIIIAYVGKVADRTRLRAIAMWVLLGLSATSLAMAGLHGAWMLLPVFLCLRLFGQGLLGHIALTAMARWFDRSRGKAISVAAMGNPVSQAVFPVIAISLIGAVGWRITWVAGAGFLVFVSMPLLFLLLRREPGSVTPIEGHATTPVHAEPSSSLKQWTRSEVLRDPAFWLLLPGVLAPPFVGTGIFFQQAMIVEVKGWSLAWFVGWFGLHAATTIGASFATGWAVDRFGSMRALPFFLLPLTAAAGLLAMADNPLAVPVFMLLSGLSMGSSGTLLGSLWAELYGTRHLGAIRSLATSGGVFASALAPGLMGILLDLGVGIGALLLGLAVYSGVAALLMWLATPGLIRRAPFGAAD